MLIGINASAALKKNPTGVEEYVFQLIKSLAMIPESRAHRFILYLNPRLKNERFNELKKLPKNFELKFLSFPFGWTQIRLAWEMVSAKIDILFIPAHILPLIHPKKSVVALHGLEFEYFPKLYPFWYRLYLRLSTRYSLKNSAKIIAVSGNTKLDLMELYGGDKKKIKIIYHGIEKKQKIITKDQELKIENNKSKKDFLYIGRIELKKNILGIIRAYNLLRIKNLSISSRLILVGDKGFGFEKIERMINSSQFKNDIILKGYVSESEKKYLLKNSAVLIFLSFYEGFGLPILEAQVAEIPIIVSNTSCLPEIAGAGAIFVDPNNPGQIAEAMEKILQSQELRKRLIELGLKNIRRFSWEKCAKETLKILTE